MKNTFKKTLGIMLATSIICAIMATGCTATENGDNKSNSNATEKATQAVSAEQYKTEPFTIKAGPYNDVEDLGITVETTNSNHYYLDTTSVNGEKNAIPYEPQISKECIKDIYRVLMGYHVNEPDENGVFEYSETELNETVKVSIPYQEGMYVLYCENGVAYDVKTEYADGCYVFETNKLGTFMLSTESTGRTEPTKTENVELAQQTIVDETTGVQVSGMLPVDAEMDVLLCFTGDFRIHDSHIFRRGTVEEDYPKADDISEFYYTFNNYRNVLDEADEISTVISEDNWTRYVGTGIDSTLEARITFIKDFEILDFESDLTVTLPFDYRAGLVKGNCASPAVAKQYDYDNKEFVALEVLPEESTAEGTFQFKIKTPGQFFIGDETPLNSTVNTYVENMKK